MNTALAAFALDLMLSNGRVLTQDPARPEAAAIGIRADRIVIVGSEADVARAAGPDTRHIDLGGALVLPGLVDSHVHLRSLGEQLTSLDLRGVASLDEVVRRAAVASSELPEGEWLDGIGWDQNLWSGGYPDHRPLTAAVPERPAWLLRIDWYAGWANAKAMQAAGITRDTPDPQGGRVVKDATGEPTGLFLGEAVNLVTRAKPARSRARLKDLLRPALARCAAMGLTEVHDAAATLEEASAFRELAEAGELPIRVHLMWKGYGAEDVEAMLAQPVLVGHRDRLTHRTLKLIIDGTMGSHGALFFDDYADDPGNRGFFVTPIERIRRLTEDAMRRGYQVATHAIGDRGISLTLDAFEAALAAVRPRDPRPRIEHLQCVRRGDIDRVKRLGLIASMQPSHATAEFTWSEKRVGLERGRGLYALRWVLDAGVPLAAGSDLPVDDESPLTGIHSALTRQNTRGEPEGGWHSEQRLTLDEALHAYTLGPAYAAFEEDRKGRIALGQWADLTILARDLRAIPASEIPRVEVLGTLVGGRLAYRDPRLR